MKYIEVLVGSSENEIANRNFIINELKKTPIPDRDLIYSLGQYLNRQCLSRIDFMYELYQKIVNVNGVIMEFGVRWGQNLSLFAWYVRAIQL